MPKAGPGNQTPLSISLLTAAFFQELRPQSVFMLQAPIIFYRSQSLIHVVVQQFVPSLGS